MQQAYFYQETEHGGPMRGPITHAVQRLILWNTAIFVFQLLFHIPFGPSSFASAVYGPPGGGVITGFLAFSPTQAVTGGFLWQPFTYMFLHGGLLHLFMNMIWLFVFGPDVERVLGTRQFFRFFIICGVLGVFATLVPWFTRGSYPPVIGASGAVMGVLIAFAMLHPRRQLILFPLPIPISAVGIVIIVVILNLISAAGDGYTSVATHFGGMAVGFLYMKIAPLFRDVNLWPRRPKATKVEDEKIAEAVNNIFRFDDERRRRP